MLSATMSPPSVCLIPYPFVTLAAAFPPKSSISPPPPSSIGQQDEKQLHRIRVPIFRRKALAFSILALISPYLHETPSATAFSLGISGPKDWLREQKKKSSKFLLAPIEASRNILRAAYLLLLEWKLAAKGDSDYAVKDVEEVKELLKSAARDCVPQERNSFVAFQAKTGVEVCTFRLVMNNASSLLDDKDPVKLEAEAILSDLIRSFTSLSAAANEAHSQFPSNRQKVADALMDTISSLNKFEQGIKDCLEI
ncbi:hypothetical protein U1Q18_042385 [Sarracenia purpurea var. burkii]